MRESDAQALARWDNLELLQDHYSTFEPFLKDVIEDVMGFTCTDLQVDIGDFLEHGPRYRMIQAQRGQAKTTITACYAVWRLIHKPNNRVLIISAGSEMAKEISNWIIQIIMNMPELECMRPDRNNGDRASVQAFDVHYSLKGPEKSPSVACLGITSNLQGRRADILIPDDIESQKNASTQVQREILLGLTRDFTSINSQGDIVYLGTPQSIDSVYNTLPDRGYQIRIWPGRYPTEVEETNYNGLLAPYITERMEADPSLRTGGGLTGDRGKPTDPDLLDEAFLSAKELDQGKAYFQLQHMLDTRLMDADRYPLKSRDILFTHIPDKDDAPVHLNFSRTPDMRLPTPVGFPLNEEYYQVNSTGTEFAPFTGTHMYVDPAGGGQQGDEVAYAVTRFLAGKVYLVDVGGFQGGMSQATQDAMTEIAVRYQPHQIDIERNFGNGAFSKIWLPSLMQRHRCAIEEPWEAGAKELRIIDLIEPLTSTGRLIVDVDLLEKDWERCKKYSAEVRPTYSFFFQFSRITRDKNSLLHDDRIDAVAGSCRHWIDHLSQDADKQAARIRQDRYNQMVSDPLGYGRAVPGYKSFTNQSINVMDKFKRK